MVQFIRKVSDSEQIKRAVLRKTGTALNVILSDCTNSRDLVGYRMEKAFFPESKNRKLRCPVMQER